jgi:hypothetical protein
MDICNTALEAIGTNSTLSENGPKYEPVAGDVVEYNGISRKGMIFNNTSRVKGLCVRYKSGGYDLLNCVSISNVKLIGHVTEAEQPISHDKSRALAKAYFAKAPEFTGSYKERQKQWVEYHELKVGDKVKVMRKFTDDADGFKGGGWDKWEWKAKQQGETFTIYKISPHGIWFSTGKYPYTALEPVKE